MKVGQIQENIYYSIMPYGNYLQGLRVPEGKQGLNIEPGLWVLSGMLIAEFLRGFFSTLGGNTANKLIELTKPIIFSKKKQLPQRQQVANVLIKIESTVSEEDFKADNSECVEAGLKEVLSCLVDAGMPRYRAEILANELTEGLISVLRSMKRDQ